MSTRCCAIVLGAVCVLAAVACTGVVPVKNVETDKLGYLNKSFSPQSLPAPVFSQIKTADPGPISFHKMTVSAEPHFESFATGTPLPSFRSTWTFINVGGPFVEALDEQTSNGVGTRQEYGLSYRNLFLVRGQTLWLNRTNSSFVMEAKSLQSFTPISLTGAAGGSLDYQFEWANQAQLMNFTSLAIRCTYGARYPASRLNARFLGDAQELSCDHLNKNGVVTEHSTRALLAYYGIAVLVRNQTAAATVNFRITDFSVE
jgi:hypothetical protein